MRITLLKSDPVGIGLDPSDSDTDTGEVNPFSPPDDTGGEEPPVIQAGRYRAMDISSGADLGGCACDGTRVVFDQHPRPTEDNGNPYGGEERWVVLKGAEESIPVLLEDQGSYFNVTDVSDPDMAPQPMGKSVSPDFGVTVNSVSHVGPPGGIIPQGGDRTAMGKAGLSIGARDGPDFQGLGNYKVNLGIHAGGKSFFHNTHINLPHVHAEGLANKMGASFQGPPSAPEIPMKKRFYLFKSGGDISEPPPEVNVKDCQLFGDGNTNPPPKSIKNKGKKLRYEDGRGKPARNKVRVMVPSEVIHNMDGMK